MKFVVIGLGSMGKRRIRLLQKKYPDIEIVGVDQKPDRLSDVRNEYHIETAPDLDWVLEARQCDAALVCTAPDTHASIILNCLNHDLHVFTEINLLADHYDDMVKLAVKRKKSLFLSSTLLYRFEIQYISDLVHALKEKVNYRYHVGQYLPDWHPWENYQDFFVGKKETNGCREIFAIELPWIIRVFGKVSSFEVMKHRVSQLKIGYEDSFMVIVTHESGHVGSWCFDVVARKAVRSLEVYSEHCYLTWDGTPDSLKKLNLETKEMDQIYTYEAVEHHQNYAKTVVENAYTDELIHFVEVLGNKEIPLRYSFEEDQQILQLIDSIERS